MTASRRNIEDWLDEGKAKGAARVIIACDTWDHDNYPVFVMPGESAAEKASGLGNMQAVDEVYDLSRDISVQLMERRAEHWGDDRLYRAAPIAKMTPEGLPVLPETARVPNLEDGYTIDTCYPCWQVGRRGPTAVAPVCVVTYHAGTPSEWTTPSCGFCLELTFGTFPAATKVIARIT